jgi:hypothetical protein
MHAKQVNNDILGVEVIIFFASLFFHNILVNSESDNKSLIKLGSLLKLMVCVQNLNL